MPAAADIAEIAALQAALAAERGALAAERAARLHLEAEMADQKAYAARLETLLREMRRARFGPRSEKLHPDQLALALEGEPSRRHRFEPDGERDRDRRGEDRSREAPRGRQGGDGGRAQAAEAASRAAGPSAAHRAGDRTGGRVCPCGCGEMVRIGEDRSHRLDVVPAQYRVLVTIRPRYACPKGRAGVVQAPAPAHLIEGGLPTVVANPLIATTSWSPSSPSTCRCTDRARSSPATA